MRGTVRIALASVAGWVLALPTAQAQTAAQQSDAEATVGTEIIVQARRRDESVQDVPVVVQAVTSENLTKLNIREFQDVQTLVPGLTLAQDANGIGSRATLRGIAYDVNASGNNGTVEFYLNDAPLSASIVFQSLFDVGQIEVLRGPQGTLRGRASPSGSITITTRKPDLYEPGGYMTGTLNDVGGWNLNGAINVPIISERLGVRIAGISEENDDNEVRSINSPLEPYRKTSGIRASVAAEPLDAVSLFFSYTATDRRIRTFDQVESATIFDPNAAPSPVLIEASDRLAVAASPRDIRQRFQVYNWQAELRQFGQKLNYVGSYNRQRYDSLEPDDKGGFYGPQFPELVTAAGLHTHTRASQETHEVRLSNDSRVAGIFDYVVGAMWNNLKNPTDVAQDTLVWSGAPDADPLNLLAAVTTPIERTGSTSERSFFGNITAHISDNTEISGGLRRIRYHSIGGLAINGVPVAAAEEDRVYHATIYSASASHRFNENLMAYASFGTSWRPGSSTNAVIQRNNITPTPEQAALMFPEPEKSKSYEIGFKSDWFDRRLRVNVSAYHQTFENFGYFAPNSAFASNTPAGPQTEVLRGIAVGVPAKVDGVEGELEFQATPNWSLGAVLSYAKSKVRDGSVPCNDYFPHDGIPDSSSQVPSYDEIMAATDGAGVALCQVNSSAGTSAPFSATFQTEYNLPLNGLGDAYLRGLVTYNGNSKNDPNNSVDDIDAYALVNLFAGVRDPQGAWEVGVYAQNIFDTERALARNATAYSLTVRSPGANNINTPYRGVVYTPQREFGVTARISFGSR